MYLEYIPQQPYFAPQLTDNFPSVYLSNYFPPKEMANLYLLSS